MKPEEDSLADRSTLLQSYASRQDPEGSSSPATTQALHQSPSTVQSSEPPLPSLREHSPQPHFAIQEPTELSAGSSEVPLTLPSQSKGREPIRNDTNAGSSSPQPVPGPSGSRSNPSAEPIENRQQQEQLNCVIEEQQRQDQITLAGPPSPEGSSPQGGSSSEPRSYRPGVGWWSKCKCYIKDGPTEPATPGYIWTRNGRWFGNEQRRSDYLKLHPEHSGAGPRIYKAPEWSPDGRWFLTKQELIDHERRARLENPEEWKNYVVEPKRPHRPPPEHQLKPWYRRRSVRDWRNAIAAAAPRRKSFRERVDSVVDTLDFRRRSSEPPAQHLQPTPRAPNRTSVGSDRLSSQGEPPRGLLLDTPPLSGTPPRSRRPSAPPAANSVPQETSHTGIDGNVSPTTDRPGIWPYVTSDDLGYEITNEEGERTEAEASRPRRREEERPRTIHLPEPGLSARNS